MADATSNVDVDYTPNMPKTSSAKPTNLDGEMKEDDSCLGTPPLTNHEDTTPEEGGSSNGTESTTENPTFNVSASDLGMSQLRSESQDNPPGEDDATEEDLLKNIHEPKQQTTDSEKSSAVTRNTQEHVNGNGRTKPYSNTTTETGSIANSIASAQASASMSKEGSASSTAPSSSSSKPRVVHDWIDVLGNGYLLKKVLREGEGVSTRPTAQSQVRMKVRGMSPSGTVDRHNSLEFTVGDGDVIQALDIVAALMEKGEVCQVKTDHRYAYGAVGRSPDIPPNTSLVYDLELIDIRGPLDYSTITEKELLNQLHRKRGRGNDLFQRKEFSLAVHSYSRAVSMITRYQEEQSVSELSPEIADLWIRCLNNLAAAQLKVEMYNEALESVKKVLELEPENVKALYRYGKVYVLKGEYEPAVQYLQKASALQPDEKAISSELQKAIKKRNQSRDQEKEMYKRMMTGGSAQRSPLRPARTSASPGNPPSSFSWFPILLGAGLVALTAVGIGYLASRYRK